jgi:hypothetical protein
LDIDVLWSEVNSWSCARKVYGTSFNRKICHWEFRRASRIETRKTTGLTIIGMPVSVGSAGSCWAKDDSKVQSILRKCCRDIHVPRR